jgi:hypothetical protein
MKEREIELTRQAVDSTLGVEGNIFMLDGQANGGPEVPPPPINPNEAEQQVSNAPHEPSPVSDRPQEFTQEEIQSAREELSGLAALPEDADVEVRHAYEEYKRDLLERAGIRLGPASWASKEEDRPIIVTGYFGKGPDGKEYVRTKEFSGGTPLDEVQFPQPDSQEGDKRNEREEEVEGIIDSAEDYYSAIEEIIETAPIEQVTKAITEAGEGYIEFSSAGLPKGVVGKYQDSLRELKKQKDLRPEEVRKRFQYILRGIKNERKAARLEDPLKASAPKVGLIEEEKQETERLDREGEASKKTHWDSLEDATARLERARSGSPEDSAKNLIDQGELVERDDYKYLKEILSDPTKTDDQKAAELKANYISQGGISNIESLLDSIYLGEVDPQVMQNMLNAVAELHQENDPTKFLKGYTELLSILEMNHKLIEARNKGRRSSQGLEMGSSGDLDFMNSLEDVAKFIATRQNEDLYGKDGIYPLIGENGEFRPENFMMWAREYTLSLHENNANDAISPLQQIVLEGRLRAVSLLMMVKTNKQQFFKDIKTGMVLDALANEALTETWAFGIIRNTSLAYRQVMISDTELPKAMQQLHQRSDLTRGDTFRVMMSAPAIFGKEGDTLVGDGTRLANDLYYHLSDKDKLIEVLGENPITEEDFKNALRIIQGKKDWDEDDWNNIDDYEGFFSKEDSGGFYYQEKTGEGTTSRYKKTYLFKNGHIDMAAFVNNLNFYNENTPKAKTISIIREIIRLKIAQKYGLDAGIGFTPEQRMQKVQDFNEYYRKALERGASEVEARKQADIKMKIKRDALRVNVKWAETASYEMQYAYGISARNDVFRRGFNAATKLYVGDYLSRQSGADTAGPIGVPQQIPIFKGLSTDMWTGLKTESGVSPYAIFEEIRIVENNSELSPEQQRVKKKELLNRLSFRDKAESEFAGNQVANGFTIFHSLTGGDELDFNQIVTFNYLEGIKYNPKKFEELVKDGFLKPMRYAFSSNSGLNLSTEVRWFDYAETKRINEKRKEDGLDPIAPIYKDVPLAEAMFSREALKGVDSSEYDTLDGRKRIVKNLARSRIAAQLRFHRQFAGVGERWNYNRTEIMIDALKTLKAYEIDPNNPDRVIETGKSFFDKEDIAWIRKNSGAQVWQMLLTDTLIEAGPEFGKGLWEGFLIFLKALASSEIKGSA